MGIRICTYIQTPIIKKWLETILQKLNCFVHCQQYADINSLLNNIIKDEIDSKELLILLLDIENELFGEYIELVKQHNHHARVLSIGYPKQINEVKQLLRSGFNGCLDVTSDESDILSAINHLKDNDYFLPSHKINELIEDFTKNNIQSPSNIVSAARHILQHKSQEGVVLTEKENTVLSYLIKGYSYKQIAQLTGVSSFAINQRTKSIYKKFGVNSRNELSYLILK